MTPFKNCILSLGAMASMRELPWACYANMRWEGDSLKAPEVVLTWAF